MSIAPIQLNSVPSLSSRSSHQAIGSRSDRRPDVALLLDLMACQREFDEAVQAALLKYDAIGEQKLLVAGICRAERQLHQRLVGVRQDALAGLYANGSAPPSHRPGKGAQS